MATADETLHEGLGIPREDFEAAHAMWRVGAPIEELAETFGCDKLAMLWYFLMRSIPQDNQR